MDSSQSKKKTRRPSLGGTRPSATNMAANAAKQLDDYQRFMDRDDRVLMNVTPSNIQKTFNARFVPCSLEEFSSIEWPDIDLSEDEAREAYPALLRGRDFYESLSEVSKCDFIELVAGVHAKARSILQRLQIHPITLERDHAEAKTFYIVDGERRTLSALYSRGRIPMVRAMVYNRRLNDVERAKIKDEANSSVQLNVFELLKSKIAIIDAVEGAKDLGIRDMGMLLGYGKDIASIIKKVVHSEDKNKLLARIQSEKLGWREIKFLLANGVDANINNDPEVVEDEENSNEPIQHKKTQKEKSRDIINLEDRLSEHTGFPCKIGFNESNGKVKVNFSTTLDEFENLLASFNRLDIKKVLDQ